MNGTGGKLHDCGQGNGYYFIRGNSWGKAILKLVHVMHERTDQAGRAVKHQPDPKKLDYWPLHPRVRAKRF